MKRRLLNVLTAVSLVLCVATVALWVRSYRVMDLFRFGASGFDLRSDGGQIYIERVFGRSARPTQQGWLIQGGGNIRAPFPPAYVRHFAGFYAGSIASLRMGSGQTAMSIDVTLF